MESKRFVAVLLPLITLILSGCTEMNEPVTSESPGIWNEFVVYPLSWLIINIAGLFGHPWGYGMAIMIVTVLIRLLILPLAVKQIKSSKAMHMIQPELEKLRQKYSSKDAVTQQKLQEEQLLLLQKYDINPMAGCLPVLVQMPILIGFYHAIMRTEEIRGNLFLWFELSSPDPYYILPALAGLLTYFQQKVLMIGQPGNPQTAMMLWMMPLMIVIFSLFLPAALPLYWIVGNIFTIIQSYFIKIPVAPLAETEQAASLTGGKKK